MKEGNDKSKKKKKEIHEKNNRKEGQTATSKHVRSKETELLTQ